MRVLLRSVDIENYRGIGRCSISNLGGLNVFVGPNGVGKTSLQNALVRFLPALAGWQPLFRDGDFRFTEPSQAPEIRLTYYFDLHIAKTDVDLGLLSNADAKIVRESCKTDSADRSLLHCQLVLTGCRVEEGPTQGALNAGQPAKDTRVLSVKKGHSLLETESLLPALRHASIPRTRTLGGADPINMPEDESDEKYVKGVVHEQYEDEPRVRTRIVRKEKQPKHAATSEGPRTSDDALRARLYEVLSGGPRAQEVLARHPDIVERTIQKFNELRGHDEFCTMQPGSGSQPILQKTSGSWVLWHNLSGGERALFAFGMLEDMAELDGDPLLIVEEPENNIHIGLQTKLLERLLDYSKLSQVFVSTHSTGFLEIPRRDADVKHWLLSPQENDIAAIDVTDLAPTSVLAQIGMTARSVGQPRYRVLVEGLSDAVVFQACLEQLVSSDLRNGLGDIVEFVVCGGPDAIRAHSKVDENANPGVLPERLLTNAKYKLNLARPGVLRQYVLFDADGDKAAANKVAEKLEEALGRGPQVKVITPWYRTLESIFTYDLWRKVHPRKRIKEGPIPSVVADESQRLWVRPTEIMSEIFRKAPSQESFKQMKVQRAFRFAHAIRESSWATLNPVAVGDLDVIAKEISAQERAHRAR